MGACSQSSSALSGTLALAKALVGERDAQKQAALKAELTDQILEGQAKLAQAIAAAFEKDTTINELRNLVRELEAERAERHRYRLAKVGSIGQFFAYRLRAADELVERKDEPEHFLCQPCFDGGKKSVLRLGATAATCSLCKTSIRIAEDPAPRPIPRRITFSPGI